MKRLSFPAVVLLLGSGALLSGCAAVAIGAGGAAGVAAVQEGGFSRAYNDTVIQTQINELWFRYDANMFSKLDMTVNKGRVLITGVVQNPEHRVEAVRLAWQPKGVEQVINEIRVAQSEGIKGFARDAWISARLRTAITFSKSIQSINYTIDTVQGTVYLMGVAQGQRELDEVVQTARRIPDVQRVVSYVKLAGEQTDTYMESQNSNGQSYQQPVQNKSQKTVQNTGQDNAQWADSQNPTTPSNDDWSAEPVPVTQGPITLYPIEGEPLEPNNSNANQNGQW